MERSLWFDTGTLVLSYFKIPTASSVIASFLHANNRLLEISLNKNVFNVGNSIGYV